MFSQSISKEKKVVLNCHCHRMRSGNKFLHNHWCIDLMTDFQECTIFILKHRSKSFTETWNLKMVSVYYIIVGVCTVSSCFTWWIHSEQNCLILSRFVCNDYRKKMEILGQQLFLCYLWGNINWGNCVLLLDLITCWWCEATTSNKGLCIPGHGHCA